MKLEKQTGRWIISGVIAGTMLFATLNASVINYSYDPAGRLVAADYGAGKSASYAYDNAGNLLLSSQPAPALQIGGVAANQFTLAWPAFPGGFTLETSPVVGPGATWSNANLSTTMIGDRFTVTIPISGATKFYRLRKP